jgi:hypothetical protein
VVHTSICVVKSFLSGGTFIVSFSNRYFPTKVIEAWIRTEDAGRINIVWQYFNAGNSENKWKIVDVYDISKERNKPQFSNQDKTLIQ